MVLSHEGDQCLAQLGVVDLVQKVEDGGVRRRGVVDGSSGLEQHLHDVRTVIFGRHPERRFAAKSFAGIDVGAVKNEQCNHLGASVSNGDVQCRQVVSGGEVDVGSVHQEHLSHFVLVAFNC